MKKKKPAELSQPGRFAYDGLERVLHEKARLELLPPYPLSEVYPPCHPPPPITPVLYCLSEVISLADIPDIASCRGCLVERLRRA